jgi:hypothetical protein
MDDHCWPYDEHVRMMRRRGVRLVAAAVVLGIVVGVPAVRGSILRAMGWALVVDEPVDAADVIVVPEWAGVPGVFEASELIQRGIATRVALLPAPQTPAEQELVRRGVSFVDENAMLIHVLRALGVAHVEVIPDAAAAGSEAEAQGLVSWGTRHQFRAIVVVSTPDRSRRVRRMLRRFMGGAPTKLMVRSARYCDFDPDRWWTSRGGARAEIVELQRLLLDVVRHPI